jgi:glycosidase
MKKDISSKIFYHIYPLGICGAPKRNDFTSPPGNGLRNLEKRIPHLQWLGVNAVYIGPLFESTAHGYDTVDYYHVDRRLGTDEDLIALVQSFHSAGIAVVLDAVLNHTGRDFFAFRDIREKRAASAYRAWYRGVDFAKKSPAGDDFSYEGWSGNYDLAKLDTANPAVREHLFGAVRRWIEVFKIDGLRLDAADVLAPDFMDALSSFCAGLDPDFWLMGEVVHGDYRNWAHAGRLDSVTNYEMYKGLWSSFNDRNFFEIAWSLNRQYGSDGMYRNLKLYNFVDNHDVNRLASLLKNPAHLVPVYGLLFTIPGVPSIYYGSEWGIRGEKKNGSDDLLRPPVYETADHGVHAGFPDACRPVGNPESTERALHELSEIRKTHAALRDGSFRQLHVESEVFAFLRRTDAERIVIAVNASGSPKWISVSADGIGGEGQTAKELFRDGAKFRIAEGKLNIEIPPASIRILEIR